MAARASRYGSMHGTPSFLQERKCFRPTGSVHSGYLRKNIANEKNPRYIGTQRGRPGSCLVG